MKRNYDVRYVIVTSQVYEETYLAKLQEEAEGFLMADIANGLSTTDDIIIDSFYESAP